MARLQIVLRVGRVWRECVVFRHRARERVWVRKGLVKVVLASRDEQKGKASGDWAPDIMGRQERARVEPKGCALPFVSASPREAITASRRLLSAEKNGIGLRDGVHCHTKSTTRKRNNNAYVIDHFFIQSRMWTHGKTFTLSAFGTVHHLHKCGKVGVAPRSDKLTRGMLTTRTAGRLSISRRNSEE